MNDDAIATGLADGCIDILYSNGEYIWDKSKCGVGYRIERERERRRKNRVDAR